MIKFPLTLCNKSHKCFYSSPLDYWCKALLIPSYYSHPRTTIHVLYVWGMLFTPFILNTHFTLIKDFLGNKSTRLYLSFFVNVHLTLHCCTPFFTFGSFYKCGFWNFSQVNKVIQPTWLIRIPSKISKLLQKDNFIFT
jgi:hypothetical protein